MIDLLSDYPYAVSLTYFLFLWLVFYAWSSQANRKEMVHLSSAGLVAGGVVGPLYTIDWWQPALLVAWPLPYTSLAVGPEDLLFGFTIFGIASVLYELACNKQETMEVSQYLIKRALLVSALLSLCLIMVVVSMLWLNIHSLVATTLGVLVLLPYLFWRRVDLIIPTLVTALLLCVVAIPGYLVGLFFVPNWIAQDWMVHNLSGYQVFGIPAEEFVWFALVALVASCLWERTRDVRFL